MVLHPDRVSELDGWETKAEPRPCEGGKIPLRQGRDSGWIIGFPGWARSIRARQVLGLGLGAGTGRMSAGAGVGGGGGEVVGKSAGGAGGFGVGLVTGAGVVEAGGGGDDTAESAGVGLTGLGWTWPGSVG